ncbi:glutathione S-transferase [Yoonia sp. R2331]|uniref:glutathione S-transferase n=1 Tax=Yoonia sp. R2331 TaxID=3237238 RepID=UPI0034E468C1
MQDIGLPILWSFRRCPYAMRARLAVLAAGVRVELREILLRDKPEAFLAASPSGTVPCLEANEVIDESRDVMIWALSQQDPRGWLAGRDAAEALIDQCDGPFKTALDHTKYAVRYPDLDAAAEREKAAAILREWDARLDGQAFLNGKDFTLADAALLPFVRQFANIDRSWFDAQGWPHLIRWLDQFLASPEFAAIMGKYPPWQPGQDQVSFP